MYDVLVIGAGPGGYPAAIRAAQLGLKTACVEKEKLGGVCLNWGCIPSKALLKTGELANKIRHASDFGLKAGPLEVDFPAVIARSRKVSERFERGVAGLFKKYGVTHLTGTAKIEGPGKVSIDGQIVEAKHVIIATGARARVFPGITVDGDRVMTYREAIVSTRHASSAIILGAGAIGIEFAYFWNAMGTQVTVVEGQDEILPIEDRELGAELRKQLGRQGIQFQVGKLVARAEKDGDGAVVELKDGTVLRADQVLVSLGVAPNVEGLGLDNVGIQLDRGRIQVDKSHRTTAPGFYAIGDVCSGGPALAHTATRQAHVCVERIGGLHVPDVDYGAMPSCTYCQPQVASVGKTQQQLDKEGRAYKVGKFPMQANGKSVGAGAAEGFVKVLVDPKHGEILGAHIIGADATEMIAEYTLARAAELTAETLITTVHAHPTASETMLEAVAVSLGHSVHL